MIDLFREHNVDFISVRENLDSSTAIGRVVIGILGLLSAFERELTGERVKASAIARSREGLRVGGTTPLGYKLVKSGQVLPNGKQPMKVVVDTKISSKMKIIWEMAADNRSLADIAKELMKRDIYTRNKLVWRKQGVALILKNPFYKGYIRYNGEINRGKHEAIIEERVWDKANRIMDAKMPGKRLTKMINNKELFLMAGLIKCGKCGSHLISAQSAGRWKKKFFYYECGRSRQGLGCNYTRIPAAGLDQAVIKYFRRAAESQDLILSAIGNAIRDAQITFEKLQAQINEKDARVIELKHQVDQLLNLAMKNSISQGTTYKTKMAEFEKEIITLEEELDKLKTQRSVAQMDASSGEFIHRNIRMVMEQLDNVPPDVQKSLLRMLVHSIVVYEKAVEINVYIQPECLPSTLAQLPLKDENPALITDQNEVLASNAPVSPGRQVWGLKTDTKRSSQHLTIQLLVKFHKRRRVGLRYSIDDPFPQERQPKKAVNIIREALYVKAHLKINPNEHCIETAEKLRIDRKRIPKLMTVIDCLPADFQQKLYECPDNRVHRIFNLKILHKIAQFETKEGMINTIKRLKPDLIE